jgi:quercetin dioxygenase-like cupin family protein
MEKELNEYFKDLFKHQDKIKLFKYLNPILLHWDFKNQKTIPKKIKEKKPKPKQELKPKQKKKEKVKCLGCSKMIEVYHLRNVCSHKCAEKYLKKYNYLSNMKQLTKSQKKYWEESLLNIKELKEKQRKDWEQSPYYECVKEIEEEIIANYDEKMASMSEYCSVSQCCKIPKGWGHELIIHNCPEYCGKILVFKRGCKFSMHYHILKQETWYVNKGTFTFTYIDTVKAITHKRTLKLGDVVTIKRGMPHQLLALEDGEILEISTEHFDSDSYRISKGD